MRPESEVLKYHLHATLANRHIVYGRAVDKDRAAVRLFEAGDESERGGLAAATLADDNEKFAGINIKVGLIDGRYGAESFRELA